MDFDVSMLDGSLNIKHLIETFKFRRKFSKDNPDYFYPQGLLIFCGSQGSGKTLSAVQYIKKLCIEYPRAILCTNTKINGLPGHTGVVPYEGIESLTKYENGHFGVIYFIDEIHLEFNSLESKNIPIEVMTEISQQRKQRKHIVGTSQVYMRMAKPLREQIKNVVICKKILNCIQLNRLVDGENAREVDGQLKFDTSKISLWFHSPDLYNSYDTYAKMKRYSKEWHGVERQDLYRNTN